MYRRETPDGGTVAYITTDAGLDGVGKHKGRIVVSSGNREPTVVVEGDVLVRGGLTWSENQQTLWYLEDEGPGAIAAIDIMTREVVERRVVQLDGGSFLTGQLLPRSDGSVVAVQVGTDDPEWRGGFARLVAVGQDDAGESPRVIGELFNTARFRAGADSALLMYPMAATTSDEAYLLIGLPGDPSMTLKEEEMSGVFRFDLATGGVQHVIPVLGGQDLLVDARSQRLAISTGPGDGGDVLVYNLPDLSLATTLEDIDHGVITDLIGPTDDAHALKFRLGHFTEDGVVIWPNLIFSRDQRPCQQIGPALHLNAGLTVWDALQNR